MKATKFVILDGAMGTLLQAAGLPAGEMPERWNLTHPERITEVGRRYAEAGSDVIYANTFGANRYKLGGKDPSELIAAGIAAAKAAVKGKNVRVALDIGPIGQLLEPLGSLSFDEAYEIFREMVVAGERAGADLVVFETMSDLYEVKAGVLAAKENTSLPVWVTMTFEANARTFVGVTVPAMAMTLSGLGVDALGFNCSLGPKELLPMVKTLSQWTELPIILKPNAGLPDPETGAYHITPTEFAEDVMQATAHGALVLGGCCGTTPEFIAALREACRGCSIPQNDRAIKHGICSATRAVEMNGEVRVIGERINPTGKKRFQEALRAGDIPYILERAIEQEDAGADILDVNVGLPDIDEPAMMQTVVKGLQSVTDLPLQIDASDVRAIEAGLRYCNGKPIVNSVNGSEQILNTVLPLCKKYGAAVVGLTMDEEGLPHSFEARIAIAERIVKAAEAYGIPREDVYIDCLTLTVSAQQEEAQSTLRAVRHVREVMGLQTVLGVSNISFGLPARECMTVAFLTEAMAAGLTLPIVNPNQKSVMDAIFAHRVLTGTDAGCAQYIARFAEEKANAPTAQVAQDAQMSLENAVERGLAEEVARLTEDALAALDEMAVINTRLIPALDRVGEKYEQGVLFLPQLINAANAACRGFDLIKSRIASRGGRDIERGKILLATVKGDIHDIGKNIVRVVLENYGYEVTDLGRDVPPERIVEVAVKEKIQLIGLSALMTTTVGAMEETIKALRASGHPCKVWVGGAVLTPEYAKRIGADYYAKDAKASVDIARAVLG